MRISKLKRAILYTLILLLPTSCHWFSPKEETVRRSMLIYTVITSNLSSSIKENIQDVKKSPYVPRDFNLKKESGDVLLILEHYEGDIPRLKRLSMDKYGVVNEEILMEYQGRSSIETELLHEVLVYIDSVFPAQESGILFSSHGSGWTPVDYYRNPVVRSFGQMDREEMDIMELASALPRKYSYIMFDACLMAGIEVAYELKDKGEYLVLSPTEIMAAGFPLGDVMEQIFYSAATLQERVSSIARSYYDYYNAPGTGGGTICVVRTEHLSQVAAQAKAIFDQDRDRIKTLNMRSLQRYYRGDKHWFYDFGHFMEMLSSDKGMYDSFSAAMNGAVVAKYATDKFLSIDIRNFSGLSIYVPNPSNGYLDNYYKGYAWNRDVGMIQ